MASRITDPRQADYWRFTPLGVARLLVDVFGSGAVTVTGHGNVLAQVAFLEGLAAEDLRADELAVDDERFPRVRLTSHDDSGNLRRPTATPRDRAGGQAERRLPRRSA